MTLRRTLKRSLSTTTRGLLQFGSGGAAPSFTPADLTGLQLWLDASDSSTVLNSISPDTPATDGQTVRRWLDKSGNGLHAEQATAANQPLLDADGQNSKGVLTFDGVNDFLAAGTTSSFNFLHNGTTSLVVIVAKAGVPTSASGVEAFCSTGISSTDIGYACDYRDLVGTNSDAFRVQAVRGVLGNSAVVDTANDDTLIPNQFNLIENVIDSDNATALNRSRSIVNGGLEFGSNANTGAPSAANSTYSLSIGAARASALPGGVEFYLAGGIAELIICNDPNTALRSSLRSYLASKWGITLS